jgi:hypothetical protein
MPEQLSPATFSTPPVERRPPYRVLGPTSTPWREGVLARVAELRFLLTWFASGASGAGRPLPEASAMVIDAHLAAAEQAADPDLSRWRRWSSSLWGAAVERAFGHLDAAEISLLRIAPEGYVLGQLPSLLAQARAHLPPDDPRLQRMARLADAYANANSAAATVDGAARVTAATATATPVADVVLRDADREAIIAAFRAATIEARREVTRVRSFRNILLVGALVLTLGAAGLVAIAVIECEALPLCFTPGDTVVCPSGSETVDLSGVDPEAPEGQQQAARSAAVDQAMRRATSSWDVPMVQLIGLIAAAVATAAALRGLRGTSTPYSLPIALAVLKLPTGALTAVLGILLMRGEFIPGLSALDTSAQILAWAIVFGYAQQLLTRMVDQRAQGVLDDIGTVDQGKAPAVKVSADAAHTV